MPGIRPAATAGAHNRTSLPLPEQADPAGIVGVWAVAGTLVADRYPCACVREGHWNRPVSAWCDCVGRTDLGELAAQCCATRAAAGAPVTLRDKNPAARGGFSRRTVTTGAAHA